METSRKWKPVAKVINWLARFGVTNNGGMFIHFVRWKAKTNM